ncbi:hypothetical protein AB1Y20_011226 [Prymnesium parvum]|uniref:Kinesin-like protein n=1 Tax=Prymnesium parvum TaxID=97485 RepID=A0AB34IMB5_PRYPA
MGNAESQPVRNVDKRTARRDHAAVFQAALSRYRATRPSDGEKPSPNDERLRVCVRRRPIFPRERDAGEFDVLTCSPQRVVVSDCRMHPDCRRLYVAHHSFGFDRVYDEHTSSEVVYEDAVKSLVVQAASSARDITVLMYGQTGSGKTYTMSAISAASARDLFAAIDVARGDTVTMSYAELGPSGVRDMLNGGAPCQPLTDQAGDVQLVPSVEVQVTSARGLLALLTFASSLRATAATGVHDASSRSHAICRLSVQRADATAGECGSLTLVDLAGSEQRIDSEKHDPKRTKESAAINSSLMALKDCVRAVSRGDHWGLLGGRHILTKLLKPAFTRPDARTVVLATVSPAAKDTEHSLNTLRHACVMDGQGDGKQAQQSWLGGGDVVKEDIGEIDTKATIAKRRAQADELNSKGFGIGDRDGIGADAQKATDARKQESEAALAIRKLERKATRLLSESDPEQHAALVQERAAAAQGPALNKYQYARLRYRLLQQQQQEEASPPPPPHPPPPIREKPPRQPQPPPAFPSPAPLAPPPAAATPPARETCDPSEGERAMALREVQAFREAKRSAAKYGRRSAEAAEGRPRLRSAGRGGSPDASGGVAACAQPDEGYGGGYGRRPTSQPDEGYGSGGHGRRPTSSPGATQSRGGEGGAAGGFAAALDDERREVARVRRQRAEEASAEEAAPRGGEAKGEAAEAVLAAGAAEERVEAARVRRQQAEEARKVALLRKLGAREAVAQPEVEDRGDEFGLNALDERREAARARRERAEEARRAALLQKVAGREGLRRVPPSPTEQIEKLQAALDSLPAGAAHDATRAGLRKQLATHRATLVREQRKREQQAREAARLAALHAEQQAAA